jgi:hypothetical protein
MNQNKIKTLSTNLNWLVIRQLKNLSKPKISNTKWKKMSEQEKNKIKEEQKIDNEFLKRNGQIILSNDIIAKERDKRYKTENVEFKFNEKTNKLENTKNKNIEEVSYQRVQDKTYNVAFKEEMDVESKQYSHETLWHDGSNFLDWYFNDIDRRYKQGEFRRPSDKLHILDEKNLNYL